MFAVEIAGDIRPRRYADREIALVAARRAAKNAPMGAAAVVWLNDCGVAKLWLARITVSRPNATGTNVRKVTVEKTEYWQDSVLT